MVLLVLQNQTRLEMRSEMNFLLKDLLSLFVSISLKDNFTFKYRYSSQVFGDVCLIPGVILRWMLKLEESCHLWGGEIPLCQWISVCSIVELCKHVKRASPDRRPHTSNLRHQIFLSLLIHFLFGNYPYFKLWWKCTVIQWKQSLQLNSN